jgi:uncharacterized protein YcfJ
MRGRPNPGDVQPRGAGIGPTAGIRPIATPKEVTMNDNASNRNAPHRSLLPIALASLLVGGVATAAFMSNRAPSGVERSREDLARPTLDPGPTADRRIDDAPIPPPLAPEYADVIAADPVRVREPLYATVIGTEPVRETATTTTPREICEDVTVEERLPERDGNVGGTVAGAVIGGLIGNQIGDGNGRKAATAAGAAAGGYIGNRVDRRHQGGQVVARTERQCRTVTDTATSSRTVAWDVTYRGPDGRIGSLRTERRPGERISLGSEERVVGYDVTYRWRGELHRMRTETPPGPRLPVVDGQVLAPVATAGAAARG